MRERKDGPRRQEVLDLSLVEAAKLVRSKELSPVELVVKSLERISDFNTSLNAFITVVPDQALEAARQAEHEIMAGTYRGPLHGHPIGHKDIFLTQGIRTTGHSRAFAGYIPESDAPLVTTWKNAGAITVGKTNTYELASGREQDLFGIPKNPWNATKVSGGSSSGSAVAVSAGLVFGASGTDGGGSIRAPAAHCGIVGLRPTYGLISNRGLLPEHWSSTNCVGPLARTVEDATILFEVLLAPPALVEGHDLSGEHSLVDFLDNLKGIRLGVPRAYFFDSGLVSEDIRQATNSAIGNLQRLGAEIIDIDMPHAHLSDIIHNVVAAAESTALVNNRELDLSLVGFSTRTSLEVGKRLTAKQYFLAQGMRSLVYRDFLQAFQTVDVIAAPTTSTVAQIPSIDAVQAPFPRRPASLAGCPALSMPCGFSEERLPIGIQLIGKPRSDLLLLQVGKVLEAALGLDVKPSLSGFEDSSDPKYPDNVMDLTEAVELRLDLLTRDLRSAFRSIKTPDFTPILTFSP